MAGIGAFIALQFGRTPPNTAGYRAAIQVASSQCASSFHGQPPGRGYWLALAVFLSNTGGIALTPTLNDWVVTDAGGGYATIPANQFYASQTVPPAQTANFTLAFDMNASASPGYLTLTLPNGDHPNALLFGCGMRTIGIVSGRSADGTNWTLTFSYVSPGLTTSATQLAIITSGGPTALASKSLNALVYSTDRAVYVQANVSTAVGIGDRLLISTVTYPIGYQYQISDGTSILAAGTLQG